MLRRNREIVIFNLSAIDLFCSGMGAVMVLMVLLMPYYRKQAPTPPPEPPPPAPVVVVTPPEPPKTEPEKAVQIRGVDVVFVMDATASMEEELSAVQSSMTSIVQVLRRLSDEVSVGFVAYIDRSVPWAIPLKPVAHGNQGGENLRKLLQAISEVRLVGNEDWPEDVCGGLAKAAAMPWPAASGKRRQIIIVIGDARTHPKDHDRSMAIVKQWTSSSPDRSVNTVHSGTPDPQWQEEFDAAKKYFQEVSKVGKGQYFQDQGDLLGSILDILIVR
jgi:Integrin beta chain VWA domain